jgi:hypothetical protein
VCGVVGFWRSRFLSLYILLWILVTKSLLQGPGKDIPILDIKALGLEDSTISPPEADCSSCQKGLGEAYPLLWHTASRA